MRISFVLPAVLLSIVSAFTCVAVLSRWGSRAMSGTLGSIAVAILAWGLWDWSQQQPRESPFYSYVLLAVAPAAALGVTLWKGTQREWRFGTLIFGGALSASLTALAIPWLVYALL